jgi:hypothetical protein
VRRLVDIDGYHSHREGRAEPVGRARPSLCPRVEFGHGRTRAGRRISLDPDDRALREPIGLAHNHWYKLILFRARDGAITGNIRIDGTLFELAPSFAAAKWPDVAVVVRQFGLLKPAKRTFDEKQRDQLRDAGADVPQRSWRERLIGR